MSTFDRVFSKKCEETHAEKNIRARIAAKYICIQVQLEVACIKINEALELISKKR